MNCLTPSAAQLNFLVDEPAQSMTPWQETIYRALSAHQGKQNAISKRDLVKITHLPERQLREIIASLILIFHVPVGSSYSGKNGGYYIIRTADEAQEVYELLKHHAISILKHAAVVKRVSFHQLINLLLEEK